MSVRAGVSARPRCSIRCARFTEIVRGGVKQGSGWHRNTRTASCRGRPSLRRHAQRRQSWLDGGILNRAILYVTALMEVKRHGRHRLRRRTAACATFPGTTLAAAELLGSDETTILRAMPSAGLIGVFVATRSSFAAEVGGCQSRDRRRRGDGGGGLGRTDGRQRGTSAVGVEPRAAERARPDLRPDCQPRGGAVPGRNIAGAANAFACANIALAGYDHLIPLDEVLDAPPDQPEHGREPANKWGQTPFSDTTGPGLRRGDIMK